MKIKTVSSNIYFNNPNYKLKDSRTIDNFQGYRAGKIHKEVCHVLTYETNRSALWKIFQGVKASTATLFTAGLGLLFSKRIKRLWQEALTGKEDIILKIPVQTSTVKAIDVPESANFAYRGSNAEFLIYSSEASKPLTLDTFKQTLVHAEQRFPRINPLNTEQLDQLKANEAEVIEDLIHRSGCETLKLPKTLYDLFYIRFHLEDRPHLVLSGAEVEKIKQIVKEKLGSNATEKEVTVKVLRKYRKLYASKGEGLGCHVPIIEFYHKDHNPIPIGIQIQAKYHKRENEEDYQRLSFEFNNRIIQYLKDNEVNLNQFSWKDMRRISLKIMSEIDDLQKRREIYEKDEIAFGKILDFAHTFTDRAQKMVLGAIWHEYQAPSNVYTIYRAAEIAYDDSNQTAPYSLSFGASAVAGSQFDGASGSPLSYCNYSPVFAVDINISDYESNGESAEMFFIPPARGLSRMTAKGETCHPRSKIKLIKDKQDQAIQGFGMSPGVPLENLDFLRTKDAENLDQVAKYVKDTQLFLSKQRTIILGSK